MKPFLSILIALALLASAGGVEAARVGSRNGVPPRVGSSLTLSNTSYVDLGTNPFPTIVNTPDLTIGMWVYTTTLGLTAYLDNSTSGSGANVALLFGAGSNNQLLLYIGNGIAPQAMASNNGVVVANSWQHLVVTMAADGSVIFYANGVNVGTATRTNNLQAGGHWYLSQSLYFGGSAGVKGNVDDLVIYNLVLSPSAVDGWYHSLTPPGTALSAYKFNEATGVTARDSVGSNNGTITLPVWSSSLPQNFASRTPSRVGNR